MPNTEARMQGSGRWSPVYAARMVSDFVILVYSEIRH
jgi:hypothetical protein